MRRKQKPSLQRYRDVTACGIDDDVVQRLEELTGQNVSMGLFLLANHQAAIAAEVRRLQAEIEGGKL